MTEYYWSTQEDFEKLTHTEIHDALTEALEDGQWIDNENEETFTVSIYRGEAIKKSASGYSPESIAEQMGEAAYDDLGDHSEGWIGQENFNGFDEAVKIFIDAWCTANHCQPDFYKIVDVKEIEFEIVMENPIDGIYQDIKSFTEINNLHFDFEKPF